MKNLVSRLQAKQIVCQRFAETPGIVIEDRDSKNSNYVLISQEERKDQKNFVPKKTCIYLHDEKMRIEDFQELAENNSKSGIYTAHIFINQNDEFFKRLWGKAQFKESLQGYSFEDKKKVVKPTDMIKRALDQLSLDVDSPRRILTFYDPENNILIGRHFGSVNLDYSYLPKNHQAFRYAKSGVSKNFMLMNDKFKIKEGGLASVVYNPQLKIATIIPPGEAGKRYRK